MRQVFVKDGKVKSFEVANGKVITTILIEDNWVSNPTLEEFYAQGWADYVPPTPAPVIPSKEELVERKLRERYTINQEFEVLRKRDVEPEAFQEYFEYVEECIRRAEEELKEV